jgi:hypothetical protein
MKRSASHLRIVRGLLLVALLFSANPRHTASNFADSGRSDNQPASVSAGEALSRVHALTAYSGQPVARAISKQDRLQHSANYRGLTAAEFNFRLAKSQRVFATEPSVPYESRRLFSVGGRDPPSVI